jgi:hypothetical protein
LSNVYFFKKQRFGSWLCFCLQVKKGGGRGSTYSVGSLGNSWSQSLDLALSKGPIELVPTLHPSYLKAEAKPASETLFFKEKTLDDGYSPKARFFDMHHNIVRTLQNKLFIRHVGKPKSHFSSLRDL